MLEKILSARLSNLHIAQKRHASPEYVVNDLVAMQAQDYGQSMWALGSRLQDTDQNNLEAGIPDGKMIRTWLFRGTLHWVCACDVRWLTTLIAPKVMRSAMTMNKALQLDESTFQRSNEAIRQILMLGEAFTREEIAEHLAASGIRDPSGMRLSHLFYAAAMEQVLCHGPRRGNSFTYVLFDRMVEQSTRKMHTDEALGILALRYFQSHGPATEQDLAWWCGLTLTDVRTGIENARNALEQFVFEGKTYWFENSENALNHTSEQEVFLLAGFDEYLMGYKDRSLFLDPARAADVATKNGIFKPVILVDGKVAGTWQRTVKKDRVEVQFNMFQELNTGQKEALVKELARYGGFLGKDVA